MMAKNYANVARDDKMTIPTPLVIVLAVLCVVAVVATAAYCTHVRESANNTDATKQEQVTSEREVDFVSAAANARGADPARVVADTTRIQRAVTSALTIGDAGISAARDAAVADGLDPDCDMCVRFLAGGSDLSVASEPSGTPEVCLVGVDGDECTYLATVVVRAGVGDYRSERRVHVVARTTSADSEIDATCAYESQGV
jgi:hypothetical protein